MTRTLALLPILLAACDVGTYGETMQNSTDGSTMGTDDRNLCANKATPTAAYIHTGADGQAATSRAGMGCVTAACHLPASPGAGAPGFGFAGTVYKDLNGTTPQGGVTVRLFPSMGNTMKSVASAVTDADGNFYITDTTLTAFPYNTDVTGCGSDAVAMGIRVMVGAITRTEANCNAGGTCHQVVPEKTATPVYLMD